MAPTYGISTRLGRTSSWSILGLVPSAKFGNIGFVRISTTLVRGEPGEKAALVVRLTAAVALLNVAAWIRRNVLVKA